GASSPERLDALSELFKGKLDARVSKPFSLKNLIRTIVLSEAYQRSAEPNETNRRDDRFYSRAFARPLDAYAYADALAAVLGVAGSYGKLPPGTRALEVADPGPHS